MIKKKDTIGLPIGIPVYFLALCGFILVGLFYPWFRQIIFWVYILFTVIGLLIAWKRMRATEKVARVEQVGFLWLLALLGLLIVGLVRFDFSYWVNLLLLLLQPIEWIRLITYYRKNLGRSSRKRIL